MAEIHILDLQFQGLSQAIASYLVRGPGGWALVEAGPASTWQELSAALGRFGLQARDIPDVLVSHIHLDHAGAAGWLAREGARIYVHEKGAPHLIDPSRLIASASRIYGDRMQKLWGTILPVPEEQVVPLCNGQNIEVGGLVFEALDTPGHADHHMAFLLSNVAFTGDVGGVRLPGTGYLSVPAPPPEFRAEKWLESVARLKKLGLKKIYPTHFGVFDDCAYHFEELERLVQDCSDRVRGELEAGVPRDDLVLRYREREWQRAREAGLDEQQFLTYETANPLFMSVDGITRYWHKKWEARV
ncbi:MAG: MBL fold metallo-hydrolase [Armatimonadetes bacterium]|nr:MBL fold metallo-hydrolase [Armatimonadota bacterium]